MEHANVSFRQADAFAYQPDEPVDWMVSDVIAYPERVMELLHLWCGKRLARDMVVTMKFQGSAPSWDALEESLGVARSYGYAARAKHFFHNKNEVTLMLQREHSEAPTPSGPAGTITKTIPPFYNPAFQR